MGGRRSIWGHGRFFGGDRGDVWGHGGVLGVDETFGDRGSIWGCGGFWRDVWGHLVTWGVLGDMGNVWGWGRRVGTERCSEPGCRVGLKGGGGPRGPLGTRGVTWEIWGAEGMFGDIWGHWGFLGGHGKRLWSPQPIWGQRPIWGWGRRVGQRDAQSQAVVWGWGGGCRGGQGPFGAIWGHVG